MVTKERIAEIRAAWAADRLQRRAEFKQDWKMHILDAFKDFGFGTLLGLCLGFSLVIWALETSVS